MPVEDHPVHPSTMVGDDHRYGCHDRKPFKAYYHAPGNLEYHSGAHGENAPFHAVINMVPIAHGMSWHCVTAAIGEARSDLNCRGCPWLEDPYGTRFGSAE